ncbi:MAG: hypothetical protein AB1430_23630 [Pseudomonadota bacterium]
MTRPLAVGVRWCFALLWLLLAGAAAAQADPRSIDHTRTGFALTGAHTAARCESCHAGGVFKGTPRDCASCHVSGARLARGNVLKPQNHVPTQEACDSCHNTRSFSGARFSHANVQPGSCSSCHNGVMASGKPGGHPATTASCDSCHRSTAGWGGARMDHSSFTAATNCASCHNGSTATGKHAAHIPAASTGCASCHGTTGWTPSRWNHTQVAVTGQCASCHSGGFAPADGRHATHVPYQALSGVAITNCDTCHKAGFAAWAPARVHASISVSAQCATCHTGSYAPAVGKPNTAIHAGATVCESCHKSTASWASARVDHGTFTAATNCASCHNGSAATGKPAAHIPVGAASCQSCHNVSGWVPTKWNHTQTAVTGQCATCHSGAYPPANGRHATHIPYQTLSGVAITNCDSCHKAGFAAWAPARFHASVSVSTQCASCHSGSYAPAVGKPNNATHAGVTVCESCHKSTASWGAVSFAHSAANAVGTGSCDNCHNGSAATGKPAAHIPVTSGPTKCDSCHRSQTSFAASVTMNHSVVTTTSCKTCHNGAYVSQGNTGALAKPANHIPEATQLLNGAAMDCGACHKSTTSWGSMTMDHNGSQGGGAGWCKGCHQSGTSYLGSMEKKSLTHERKTPPAIDCSESGCHRPLGSKGSTYRNWD